MERTGATTHHITPFEDSRRWDHVPYRPNDIVISTPPKCGTTWTQRIVMSLLWPDDDTPEGTLGQLSPWVDIRGLEVADVAAHLDAQDHRRFIKTHTPADGIPLDPDVQYVIVYRSAADALVSWGNHREKMRAEIVEMLNGLAEADDVGPVPLTFGGDYDELLIEWTAYWSPAIHLAPWWPLRHEPNVHVIHYRDLDADLPAEMARLAAFLGIDVPAELWPATVERCRLDAMRTEANGYTGRVSMFEGGPNSFFYKGGVGRGRKLLTDAQLDAVQRHVEERLPADAAVWLEAGGPLP